MFEVTSTGKKYGKDGERIKMRDTLLVQALKEDWIKSDGVNSIGNDKRGRKKKVVTNEIVGEKLNG